jgi:hypothetical protein
MLTAATVATLLGISPRASLAKKFPTQFRRFRAT